MHPDAEVVLRGFKAFGEGDVDGMRAVFHDDAVWHTPGTHRFAGDHRGVDAILGLFNEVSQAATIDNRPHDVLATDDHVVVLADATLTKDGERLESQSVFVFHVTDERVAEAWAIPADQAATDAFWGS